MQVRGVTDAGLKPRKVSRVAVLGGGLMGSGIATALVLSGVNVVLKEVNQQFLDVSGENGDGVFLGVGGSTFGFGWEHIVRGLQGQRLTTPVGHVVSHHGSPMYTSGNSKVSGG